ncbi:MAG: hypothetical protein AAB870_01980 [Patescibacteria group bacterium]
MKLLKDYLKEKLEIRDEDQKILCTLPAELNPLSLENEKIKRHLQGIADEDHEDFALVLHSKPVESGIVNLIVEYYEEQGFQYNAEKSSKGFLCMSRADTAYGITITVAHRARTLFVTARKI